MKYEMNCPFCGSMPVLMTAGVHQANMECPNCGARLPASPGPNRYRDAIRAWRRRAFSNREKDMLCELAEAADILEIAGEIEEHGEMYTEEVERIRELLRRILSETDQ